MKYLKLFENINVEDLDPFDEEDWDEYDDDYKYEGKWLVYKEKIPYNSNQSSIWIGQILTKYEICRYKSNFNFDKSTFIDLKHIKNRIIPLLPKEIKRIKSDSLEIFVRHLNQYSYNKIKKRKYDYSNRISNRFPLSKIKKLVNINDSDIIFGNEKYMIDL